MSFSAEGLLGPGTRAVGELVIGFMIFAVAVTATGAGTVFINLANAIFGFTRGGPAKVAWSPAPSSALSAAALSAMFSRWAA